MCTRRILPFAPFVSEKDKTPTVVALQLENLALVRGELNNGSACVLLFFPQNDRHATVQLHVSFHSRMHSLSWALLAIRLPHSHVSRRNPIGTEHVVSGRVSTATQMGQLNHSRVSRPGMICQSYAKANEVTVA
jgi:hypothetical protein